MEKCEGLFQGKVTEKGTNRMGAGERLAEELLWFGSCHQGLATRLRGLRVAKTPPDPARPWQRQQM